MNVSNWNDAVNNWKAFKMTLEGSQVMPLLDTNGPDFITDPYVDEKPNRREKETYHAILKMHAGTLESAASQQSLNTQA
ncbi:unnamed protein product [Onchocerca flexuosa]|uniref:Zinc finger, CCHC-type n=1 Tax=Onchocerca flexuosa TaxID=387005 RepID=A0A183I207_9BILA|nr:unnamed protein product [Onchocerca flexuosa]